MSEHTTSDIHGFWAGAARIRLEFPENFFPHKSFRGRYFTGVYDGLYVRALMMGSENAPALLVSIELGDISDEWLQDIAQEAGVPMENVFLTATHTHAAPHAGGTWPEDVIDTTQGKAFSALCRECTLHAVRAARKVMRPARLRYGAGRCDINVNRDYRYTGTDGSITAPYIQAPNHGGISDKTVAVLAVEDMHGQTIAYHVNYAIHSNVTFYQTWAYEEGMLVTGDLSGMAMRYVEDRSSSGCVALFTMGAAADQMPKYLSNHRVFDKDGNASWQYYGSKEGLALADAQASALGAEILRIDSRLSKPVKAPAVHTAVAMMKAMGKMDGAGIPSLAAGSNECYTSQYRETLQNGFSYIPTEPITMRLSVARFGPVVLVCVPAELVTSIGADIRCAVAEEDTSMVIVACQCNGSFSYISDDDGYEKMTFEAMASHFMPGVAGSIVECVKELTHRIDAAR